MATNTIANCTLAEVAQESLDFAQSVFAPLSQFLTDFASEPGSGSILTRIPTRPTAVDLSGGYTSQDTAMTAKTITLNQFPGFVWGFNDLERSKSTISLNDLFVQPALQAVGAWVFGYIWNLVTASAFTNALDVSAADFDRDNLADLSATLTGTLKAPKMNRALLINPTYYAALVKTLNSAEVPGIGTDKAEGIVPRCAGFNVYESDLCDGNSEDLAGFACHKSAIILAARSVDSTGFLAARDAQLEDVVVPGLGLPLQWRRWYDPNSGELKYSLSCLFGASVGTNYGVRITTP